MFHIIANEKHLKGKNAKKLQEVTEVFERAGKAFEIHPTYRRGDARKITEEITFRKEENVIVAMGGDGTLHDVINGFRNFETCALGLIPIGTGNDFAESANLPFQPRSAAEIIAFRAPEPVDFIELSSGLRSINAVGMGIDVDVLKRTYEGRWHGKSKYLIALIKSLVHFKSCNFTLQYDGKEERHFGLIAALGNGKQLGGGIKLFPDAKINDGMLDLLVVDYISKRNIIGAFIKLMRGKINDLKTATVVRTKAATFIQEAPRFTIQAEGELYEDMPLEAHIVEGKLKFFLPEHD